MLPLDEVLDLIQGQTDEFERDVEIAGHGTVLPAGQRFG